MFRLPRKIPFNVAMELALTGDPISAERAHHFGLVNRLVEPGTVPRRRPSWPSRSVPMPRSP
jgi:enoyl-CoA hydratase/carnithine racemase